MQVVGHQEVVSVEGIASRWSPWKLLALSFTLLLAATQVLVWVKAIEVRGGPEVYVRGIDLMPTLAAGVAIREGKGPLLYDFATQLTIQNEMRAPYPMLGVGQLLPYDHLPFEALLVVPFLKLPYGVLYGAFTLLALLSVGVSLWLIASELPDVGQARWVLMGAAFSYQPLYQAFWLGQTSPFILLGTCGTYVALNRRREQWAAVSLLLVVLKPQVFVVVALLLLLLGHWRVLAIVAGILAGASVAVMPVLGAAWPLHYAKILSNIARWNQPSTVYPASMPTTRGLAVNLLGPFAPTLVMPAAVLLSTILVGTLVWCWWRVRHISRSSFLIADAQKYQLDLLWALTGLVAVLIPFHMGPHDHTLLLFPAWILVSYLVCGICEKLISSLWFVLLWSEYAVTLLTPFVMETPAKVVVPTVLLLLAGVFVLVWQIHHAAAATWRGITRLSLSRRLVT